VGGRLYREQQLVIGFANSIVGGSAHAHNLGLEAWVLCLGILAESVALAAKPATPNRRLFSSDLPAGLKVNLLECGPQTLMIGLLVLAVACVVKFTGAYIGSRVGGLSSLGRSGNGFRHARGAMEIIVATIGLSGVLNHRCTRLLSW